MKPTPITSKLQKIPEREFLNSNVIALHEYRELS